MAPVEKAPEKAPDGAIDANQFLGALGSAIKDAMKQGIQEVNPKRDNPNYEEDSDRKPKGVVKEVLTRKVIFKGIPQEDSQLTPEECHLFNQLQPCAITLNVGGLPRLFQVINVQGGSTPEIKIDFPLSTEERAFMPSLVKILRAIIAGVEGAVID